MSKIKISIQKVNCTIVYNNVSYAVINQNVDGADIPFLLSDNIDLDGDARGQQSSHLYSYPGGVDGDYFEFDTCLSAALCSEINQMFTNALPVTQVVQPIQPAFCTISGVEGSILYTGLHSYHSHHGSNHNSQTLNERDSYFVGVELESECNSVGAQNWLKSLKSNWFYLESDGSLSNYGAELITIKLNKRTAIDVHTWKELTKTMSDKGITSHNNNRCGLHVHISKTGLGKTEEEQDRTMLKLLHLYHNELGAGGFGEDYISKVCRRPYSSYCSNVVGGLNNAKQTAFNFIRLNKLESLSLDGIKNLSKDMCKGQPSRVEAINRMNTNTIEFRQGKGTLKPESIVTTIQFCCEIVEFCRVTNEKNCTRDNFFKRIEKLSKTNPLRLTLIPSRDI